MGARVISCIRLCDVALCGELSDKESTETKGGRSMANGQGQGQGHGHGEEQTFDDIVAALNVLGCSVVIPPKDLTHPPIVCRVSKLLGRDQCLGEGSGNTPKDALSAAILAFQTNCTAWYTDLTARALVAEQLASAAGDILE